MEKERLTPEALAKYVSYKPSFVKVDENIKYYSLKGQNILDNDKYPQKKVLHIIDNAQVSDDQKRNRIPLTYARLITEKATAISFSIPVKYLPKSESDKDAAEIINNVFEKNKLDSKQINLSDSLYGTGICAEIWYVDSSADEVSYNNGATKGKPIKVKVIDALEGQKFYPVFNNMGNMTGFVRLYKIQIEGSQTYEDRIDVLTDEWLYTYRVGNASTAYEYVDSFRNRVGKILAIYGCQKTSDFEDVKSVIDRLSALVSGLGDINDYTAAPIMLITGIVRSLVQKGDKGGVLQLNDGGQASLLESSNNFKGVELEVATLRRVMQEISQTPSLAFEDLKGISNISGKALTIMLTDALLKATRKKSIWSEYLYRRVSVVKAMLKVYHSIDIDNSNICIEMTNYTINDFSDKISDIMALAGGKALLSRETALSKLDLGIDIAEEVKRLDDADSKLFNFTANINEFQ